MSLSSSWLVVTLVCMTDTKQGSGYESPGSELIEELPDPPKFDPVIPQMEEAGEEWDKVEHLSEKVVKFGVVRDLKDAQLVDRVIYDLCHKKGSAQSEPKWALTHGRLTSNPRLVTGLKDLLKLSRDLRSAAADGAARYELMRKHRQAVEDGLAKEVEAEAEAAEADPTLARLRELASGSSGPESVA